MRLRPFTSSSSSLSGAKNQAQSAAATATATADGVDTNSTATTATTISSSGSTMTAVVRSSRSLGVGVSFGDIVALDSFDNASEQGAAEDDRGSPRRTPPSSRSSTWTKKSRSNVPDRGEERSPQAPFAPSASKPGSGPTPVVSPEPAATPPPRRMHTMPAVATKLAPAPPLQRVSVPDRGGEKCLLLDPDQEDTKIRLVWDRLTEDERSRLSDPSMIIRHVRAEKGNVDKALHKCRGALNWRAAFGVERMHEWLDVLQRENATGKLYVRGYDADGRAYLYMRPSCQNTNNEHEQMMCLVWNLEKAIACTRRKSVELGAKIPLEKINLVIDYHGFTLRNAPSMSASKYTLDVLQKYYPERMHRAYCVNAPFVFQTFFALIKAFIDPATKEKIVFVTTDDCSKLVSNTERVDKLEAVVGGPADAREFDSRDYLSLPFDISFDERGAEI